MPKIRINASEAGVRKNLSSAYEEFLRHCRLRNLSPRNLEYYRENLYYIQRILKLNYADIVPFYSDGTIYTILDG